MTHRDSCPAPPRHAETHAPDVPHTARMLHPQKTRTSSPSGPCPTTSGPATTCAVACACLHVHACMRAHEVAVWRAPLTRLCRPCGLLGSRGCRRGPQLATTTTTPGCMHCAGPTRGCASCPPRPPRAIQATTNVSRAANLMVLIHMVPAYQVRDEALPPWAWHRWPWHRRAGPAGRRRATAQAGAHAPSRAQPVRGPSPVGRPAVAACCGGRASCSRPRAPRPSSRASGPLLRRCVPLIFSARRLAPLPPRREQVFSQPVFAAVERQLRHKNSSILAKTGRVGFRIAFRSLCERHAPPPPTLPAGRGTARLPGRCMQLGRLGSHASRGQPACRAACPASLLSCA